jgi:hypothetical protein
MSKILKIVTAWTLCMAFMAGNAFASVLGSEQISGWKLQLADSTYLYQNVFMSDQASVKEQTEYYCEYTPNSAVRPVVINGSEIYGKRNIAQAADYMKANGLQPMLGINADYFSFKTGVPMGHTIMNGELVTKDATGQDAIGFNTDGTAFISWLEIQTTLSTDEQTIYIDNVNKYRQPGAFPAFLLTDKFGDDTKASTWGIDVILGSVSGPMTIGGQITAVIEDIGYNDGEIEIPDGKMVLTMGCDGYEPIFKQIESLQIGQTVTISNTVSYDAERWSRADSGLGGIGGRLIDNGAVGSDFEAGSAPRTAVGVKADGTVVFYVLDGRQKGYSYGAKIFTIAQRMAELGCVDAINLDGGGSTTMAGVYPGSDTLSILNSPSEGTLRSCANFIFLQNTQQPTGQVKRLYLYPYTGYYLNGMTQQLDVKAVDTGDYKTDVPPDVTYSAYHTDTSVSPEGTVTFAGDGETVITAESAGTMAYGQASFMTYRTPTDIVIKNESTGDTLSNITGSVGQSIDLTATAYAGRNVLKSRDDLFKWEVSGEIGSVDPNGVLKLDNAGRIGVVRVSAGDYAKEINVTVRDVGEQDKHPAIEVAREQNDANIVAYFSSIYGSIDAQSAVVRVDGVDVSAETEKNQTGANSAQIVYHVPDGFYGELHKVTFEAVNSSGYKSMWSGSFGESGKNSEFADMDGHWADKVVSYMSAKNIVNGADENGKRYFKPNDVMTRAEFAVMMANYLGLSGGEQAGFADSASIPSWAKSAVNAAYHSGIIRGRQEDGKLYFAPNDTVTRAEMATVLGRILPENLYKIDLSYWSDSAQIPAWSYDGFSIMCGSGLLTGYNNELNPTGSITRAEALQMLYNIL